MNFVEVDVADLLQHIIDNNETAIVQWLCTVRESDGCNHAVGSVSKACDAVLSTLIRLFCARYITRDVNHLEHFCALLCAAYEPMLESDRRWQRIANVCSYLLQNQRKAVTMHVFPGLKSPIPELDGKSAHDNRTILSKNKIIKCYQFRIDEYVSNFRSEVESNNAAADGTKHWLDGDRISDEEFVPILMTFEHCLVKRDCKSCHRIMTYLIAVCPELRTCQYASDVTECLWKVIDIVMEALYVNAYPDVVRYVQSCKRIFFSNLPLKKVARQCRLSLLYYVVIVMCDRKTKSSRSGLTDAIINLPVTLSESTSYLSIFPRLS